VLAIAVAVFGQPSTPHISAITPPSIPGFAMRVYHITNRYELHGVPPGFTVDLLQMNSMQIEEVLDVWKTNRWNCYIVVLKKPEVPTGLPMFAPNQPMPMMLTPEDAFVLSNYHRAGSKLIVVPEK
jgi:hypothetical protein